MIHREGRASLLIGVIFSIALVTVFYLWLPKWVFIPYLIALFIIVFLLQFFRNPQRNIPQVAENVILSPADGKVVVIEEVTESEYLHEKRIQVSIFMSPTNVHANRNPVSGTVLYKKYHPGKYLVAWHPKSSTENERTTIVYQAGGEKVLMRQIAGAMARRIVNYLHEEQSVIKGDEMGFIKFGSRVDLFLPLNTKLNIELNQAVTSGISIIGALQE